MELDYSKKFSVFYSQHFSRIEFYAYNYLLNREEANSVAQNSFMKLWIKREAINYTEDVLPFLIAITRNECLTILKRKKSRQVYQNYIQYRENNINLCALNNDSSIELYSKELCGIINHALEKMPNKIRETFLLSRDSKLKNREIAIKLDIAESTVEYRLKHAYMVLKKY